MKKRVQVFQKPQSTARRQAIFALAGGTVALLAGCSSESKFSEVAEQYTARESQHLAASGELFDNAQMKQLSIVCDLIIPRTETASASDVDTHGFIDNQLLHCYAPEQQNAIKSLLSEFDSLAQSAHKKNFIELEQEQQTALVLSIDSPADSATLKEETAEAYALLKFLTVYGYVTSEEGATQHLSYVVLPQNGFEVDVPVAQAGKSRSSFGMF